MGEVTTNPNPALINDEFWESALKSMTTQTVIVKAPSVPKKKPSLTVPPLEPLSKETWDQMSGKARWDSIVALRGPDLKNSDAVKLFTTSVIRHRLSGVMRVGGTVNSKLPLIVVPSKIPSMGGIFNPVHFLEHVKEAAGWLGIPLFYCSETAWKMILENAAYSHIIDHLIEETEDPHIKAALKAGKGIY